MRHGRGWEAEGRAGGRGRAGGCAGRAVRRAAKHTAALQPFARAGRLPAHPSPSPCSPVHSRLEPFGRLGLAVVQKCPDLAHLGIDLGRDHGSGRPSAHALGHQHRPGRTHQPQHHLHGRLARCEHEAGQCPQHQARGLGQWPRRGAARGAQHAGAGPGVAGDRDDGLRVRRGGGRMEGWWLFYGMCECSEACKKVIWKSFD